MRVYSRLFVTPLLCNFMRIFVCHSCSRLLVCCLSLSLPLHSILIYLTACAWVQNDLNMIFFFLATPSKYWRHDRYSWSRDRFMRTQSFFCRPNCTHKKEWTKKCRFHQTNCLLRLIFGLKTGLHSQYGVPFWCCKLTQEFSLLGVYISDLMNVENETIKFYM